MAEKSLRVQTDGCDIISKSLEISPNFAQSLDTHGKLKRLCMNPKRRYGVLLLCLARQCILQDTYYHAKLKIRGNPGKISPGLAWIGRVALANKLSNLALYQEKMRGHFWIAA